MVCELKVLLKRQTPYIHFQHQEKGSTLRATEVKPKLDKFLIKKLRGVENIDAKWFVKEDKTKSALNYKMRFVAEESNSDVGDIKDYKFYFGNQNNVPIEQQKQIVFKNVEMTITCFLKDLKAVINDYIKEFFVLENFGSRQSKGFGGFLVDGTTLQEISEIINKSGCACFWFKSTTAQSSNYKEQMINAFKNAVNVYSIMKSGINSTRFTPFNRAGEFNPDQGYYKNRNAIIKGYIRSGFLPDGIGSDKAFTKSKVLPVRCAPPNADRKLIHRYKKHDLVTKYLFTRALLGLADHYEYRDDLHSEGKVNLHNNRVSYDKQNAYIINFDNATIENDKCFVPVEDLKENTGIKRFKSPVTIKIFNIENEWRFVFMINNTFEKVLKKVFIFATEKEKEMLEGYINEGKFAKSPKEAEHFFKKAQSYIKTLNWIKTPSEFDEFAFVKGYIAFFERIKNSIRQPINGRDNVLYLSIKDITLIEGGGING